MALQKQSKSNNREKTVIIVDVSDPQRLLKLKKKSLASAADDGIALEKTIDSGYQSTVKSKCMNTSKDTRSIEETQPVIQICSLCNERCESAAYFVKHVMTNHVHCCGIEFSCPFCKYASSQKSALGIHMQTHTLEKPFACQLCPKAFHQKVGLIQHMRSHSKARPFACPLCTARFKAPRSLEVHQAVTHRRLKLYECEVCRGKFGTASNLRSHMRVHTGERPYQCNICSKTFVQKGHLVTHKRLHTGEKPFRCQYCESSFTHVGNLRQHEISQHTKDYKYRCDKCNKGFINPAELKRHLVSSHTAVPEPVSAYMLLLDD